MPPILLGLGAVLAVLSIFPLPIKGASHLSPSNVPIVEDIGVVHAQQHVSLMGRKCDLAIVGLPNDRRQSSAQIGIAEVLGVIAIWLIFNGLWLALRTSKRVRDRGWLVCGIGYVGLAGSLGVMHAQVENKAYEDKPAKEGDPLIRPA